ncbi:lipocalin family protein [Vibrio metschnikovii]
MGQPTDSQDQQGLDWFVLHLDQQRTLSVTRHRYLHQRPHIYGTLASKDGKVTHLTEQEIKMIPLPSVKLANGKTLPLQWQVVIAKENIDITLSPLNPNLWLDFTQPYCARAHSFSRLAFCPRFYAADGLLV